MSEVVVSSDELDDYVRPRVEMVLVSQRRNTSITLHLMDDEHWMEPACHAHAKYGWVDKSVTLYPRNYAPFCTYCVEEHFGIEVSNDE